MSLRDIFHKCAPQNSRTRLGWRFAFLRRSFPRIGRRSAFTMLLSVQNLRTWFPVTGGIFRSHIHDIKAVDDLGFEVAEGSTVGLVGERGSGKSTIGKRLLKLVPASSGSVLFDGKNI